MTINNRGLSGQPILPYVDYRSYMGSDIFIDLTFLDHTGSPVTPTSATYRIDDLTNAVPMVASTSITNTKAAATAFVGFAGVGNISNDILTVSIVNSGIINVGDVLVFSGLPSGTTILSQITGTTGGVGTYRMSFPSLNSLGSTGFSTTSNVLYVTSVAYGSLTPGDQIVNSQYTATIQALLPNPNPAVLTGTLWLLAGDDIPQFGGLVSVTSSLPSSYTLQIPGSQMQMTHQWQGSQICQIWFTVIWKDPVTNQSATANGVAVVELLAVQTPNGAL